MLNINFIISIHDIILSIGTKSIETYIKKTIIRDKFYHEIKYYIPDIFYNKYYTPDSVHNNYIHFINIISNHIRFHIHRELSTTTGFSYSSYDDKVNFTILLKETLIIIQPIL